MDLKVYLADQKRETDIRLRSLARSWREGTHAPELVSAMEYSLNAGGKRLRPVLAMATYSGCGGRDQAAWRGAAALEMIHTYTLIHDDLPSMDDDDFRRGQPTCHRKFGVRTATLAGSALLQEAFAELAGCCVDLELEDRRAGEVIADVAVAVGGGGVIGGQLVDLESENRKIQRHTLHYIHTHKTAALLRTSCTLGGRLAGADGEKLEALAAYGDELGLAFQIVDDLLDVEGDSAELGKTAGSDQARGKATFPALYGLRESHALAEQTVERACERLRGEWLDPDGVLAAIARFVLERKS